MKNKTTTNSQKNVDLNNSTLGVSSIEDFDDKILEISLRRPKRAFNYYIMEMKEKDKSFSKISELTKEYGKKWKKMTTEEKEKYDAKAVEDKERYAEHLALVRKYVLEKPLKESTTAFRIFIDEKVRDAMENGEDIKEAKEKATAEWKDYSDNKKKEYEEKREKLKDLYEDLKANKATQISGYTLYCRDQFAKAREKNQSVTLKDCGAAWSNVKEATKDKYNELAEKEKEERLKHRDLYEVAFGIKPKRPLGAYNFFLMERAKQGKFNGSTNIFKEAGKIWKTLKKQDKERYQKIAKKAQLLYMIKKMEYLSANKKPKAKTALNFFMADMKDKVKDIDLPKGGMFNYCYDKWKKMDVKAKSKYEKMAQEDKDIKNEEKEELHDKIFKRPKRPANPYNRYIKERYENCKTSNPDKSTSELMKIMGEEWSAMKDAQKKKFSTGYDEEMEKYREKVKEFEKLGFYTPEENEKKSVKKSVKKIEKKEAEKKEEDKKDGKKGKAKK